MRYDFSKVYPDERVRKRKSYDFYLKMVKDLQSKGISPNALNDVIQLVHTCRDGGHRYMYSKNRHHAEQSIELLKKDLKL
jgi:hypothetical protein